MLLVSVSFGFGLNTADEASRHGSHPRRSRPLGRDQHPHRRSHEPGAQREGLLAPDTDLEWTGQVYYALLGEAINRSDAQQDPAAQDPDALATLVIDTLLQGAGPRG